MKVGGWGGRGGANFPPKNNPTTRYPRFTVSWLRPGDEEKGRNDGIMMSHQTDGVERKERGGMKECGEGEGRAAATTTTTNTNTFTNNILNNDTLKSNNTTTNNTTTTTTHASPALNSSQALTSAFRPMVAAMISRNLNP